MPAIEGREETLDRLRRWYERTANPLYAWEAVARCLHADNPPAIPDWCLPCVRDAASNLLELSRGRDFRPGSPPSQGKLSTDQAMKLVASALSLSKQGQKNAFAKMRGDRQTMTDFNTYWFYDESAAVLDRIAVIRNVTRDRARRVVTKGKKLLAR
jgi:hypothetical protein